jgi:para-aminobenzoate synthetase component I
LKRVFKTFAKANTDAEYPKFLNWAVSHFEHVVYLSSSGFKTGSYSEYEALLAVGVARRVSADENSDAFNLLKNFVKKNQEWMFGFLSYDLKNQLEKLSSSNPDGIQMPLMNFFIPQILFIFKKGQIDVGIIGEAEHEQILHEVNTFKKEFVTHPGASIKHRTGKDEYLKRVSQIKKHIQKGDIYEANYCIEFYSENTTIDPVETFTKLNRNSPAPYACFTKSGDRYLISSSPERFLAKRGRKLISEPIKGTIRRGTNSEEDQLLKNRLRNDPKERSENIMIVDLVRNDLSRTAVDGSVKVKELCGIYSYKFVHQMISTIESTLSDDFHFVDAIAAAFPMGSMTGAPKVRAMQIIEKYEMATRGLYSGAVGYIDPRGDFDFNVIIRSILYNQTERYLSFMAGSAITIASDPEKEYDECLLKAASMATTLSGNF